MTHPSPITPLALTWVSRGDVIVVTNEIAQRTEPLMVMSPCEHPVRGYHCVTCQRHCVNLANLVMHLERGGVHHVAVWCPKHACYEAPDPVQAAAFTAVAVEAVEGAQ